MNRKKQRSVLMLLGIIMLTALTMMVGCAGSDGANGSNGTDGTNLTAGAKAETCTLCHADDYAPPADVHPKLAANLAAPFTASIDSVLVTSVSDSTVFTIGFTVLSDGNYVPALANRANPSATGTASANLAFLRLAYAKLVTDPTVTGGQRWVSLDQDERVKNNLTDNGGGSYTYICSKLTSTGVDIYDGTAPVRIGLQIASTATGGLSAGVLSNPLQITQDVTGLPALNGGSGAGTLVAPVREVVTTAACAECHGTGNGIAHGTRYNANYCVVCHTAETLRSGETVNFKTMIHQIHTSQTRSFLDSAELTYPQDITNCIKCHKNGAQSDNWKEIPSIEACGSCHTGVNFATGTGHGGSIRTNAECAGCHDATYVETKHLTINATTHNPSVPAGDVNFAYDISGVKLDSTSTSTTTKAIITFRILANENATPSTAVTFASYTTGATMLTVGTHTFSGSPSFLVAYAASQEGLASDATTLNDYNNLGKAAAQPASVSITNLWDGTKGTLTGPVGGYYTATISTSTAKFPAGARMRSVALQGYFTQVDTATARHAISVTGTVSGDTVRRSVVDPAKCANCHEWFEGHGGNRVYETQVCVMCHNPNLSSGGRGADPATVLSRMSTSDQAKMTAAGFNPADPTTYPEESMNFKDLIHATHASGIRTAPFRFVRDRGTSGVYYYDMSEVTFPGVIGNCETCHKPGTYNLPTTPGLLSSTYETTDGSAATSVTTDRSTVPNTADLVTSPSTASCITCHDTNVPVAHINAQDGSVKATRSNTLR